MKKRVLSLMFLVMFLIGSFVIVLTEETNEDNEEIKEKINEYVDVDKVKHEFGAIQGGLDNKTENVLKREVKIKEPFDKIVKAVLGIRGEDYLTIEKLVISISILIIIFIFSLEILELTAFKTDWVKNTIATVITIIFTITGIIYSFTGWFYKIVNNIWIFIGIIAVIFAVLFVVKSILKIVRKQKDLSKADELGIKAGSTLKGFSKISEEVAKESRKV